MRTFRTWGGSWAALHTAAAAGRCRPRAPDTARSHAGPAAQRPSVPARSRSSAQCAACRARPRRTASTVRCATGSRAAAARPRPAALHLLSAFQHRVEQEAECAARLVDRGARQAAFAKLVQQVRLHLFAFERRSACWPRATSRWPHECGRCGAEVGRLPASTFSAP
jgi:hypothetical protein